MLESYPSSSELITPKTIWSFDENKKNSEHLASLYPLFNTFCTQLSILERRGGGCFFQKTYPPETAIAIN